MFKNILLAVSLIVAPFLLLEAQVTPGGNFSTGRIDTSAELLAIVTDETGTGALVFGTSPTFTTEITTPKVDAASDLFLGNSDSTNRIHFNGADFSPFTSVSLGANNSWLGAYATAFAQTGSNGQRSTIQQATTTVNSSAAATLTAASLIPAGSVVFGVTIRITTGFGTTNGLTSISIGDGTDTDRWGATIAITANTTTTNANTTITTVPIYAAATNVVITGAGDGGNEFDATGVIRITVHYVSLTAATS